MARFALSIVNQFEYCESAAIAKGTSNVTV
jgi:hypothetical protein